MYTIKTTRHSESNECLGKDGILNHICILVRLTQASTDSLLSAEHINPGLYSKKEKDISVILCNYFKNMTQSVKYQPIPTKKFITDKHILVLLTKSNGSCTQAIF